MENELHNSAQVQKTLDLLVPLLNELKVEYRILGSVIMAAINGKLHRKLGDVDLIIDSSKRSILRRRLLGAGFYDREGIFKFGRNYLSLDTLDHQDLLEVGLFAGTFKQDGSFVIGNEKNNISVDGRAVVPHQYQLLGHSIMGLLPSVIAAGIYMSQGNPKREQEKAILRQKQIVPTEQNYTHVKLLSVKADWVYYFGMWLLNVIGFVRVTFGKPYDPWR